MAEEYLRRFAVLLIKAIFGKSLNAQNASLGLFSLQFSILQEKDGGKSEKSKKERCFIDAGD